jgi:hypothetical protein
LGKALLKKMTFQRGNSSEIKGENFLKKVYDIKNSSVSILVEMIEEKYAVLFI